MLRTVDASGLLPAVRGLLHAAFDGDFSAADWAHTLGGWHVVVLDDGIVVAHAAVVARTLHIGDRPVHTGYVEGVATMPARQRQGLGTQVMVEAAAVISRDFELGALSTGRPDFYERLGWERWRGPTYVRRGAASVRTPEEDDAVLVLRCAGTAEVDLEAAITCESRTGDDW